MRSVFALVPKNALSLCVGLMAQIPLPSFVLLPLLRAFCSVYGVREDEALRPLQSFSSLGEFFIRELKPGVRPIGSGVVSPVDGSLEVHGPIVQGQLLQVKGQTYSAAELLADEELARAFDGGYFLTLYLAPGDYHHIHSPIDGKVTHSTHVEGSLWPVNSWSVRNVPRLFVVNERVIAVLESGGRRVAVVMVGATNVGSIRVAYDETLRTNRRFLRAPRVSRSICVPAFPCAKGGRLGTFHLGSTVIVLFEPNSFQPTQLPNTRAKVCFGQSLGIFHEHVGVRAEDR